ncbi:hypothetical protein [Hymenobacter sp. BT491]|uniref:hypothetical protein n=1 Tax=Hymenobacter sp. BT491 TaxID=2766779 RepID=UPI001653B5CE|nr:hypothetical protein [Hymenobacter sp. BT491]MBC6988971.1 hypothetical protein [Hymenobacter sp. BT491]
MNLPTTVNTWAPEELARFTDLYPHAATATLLEHFPGRSEASLVRKAGKIGLYKTKETLSAAGRVGNQAIRERVARGKAQPKPAKVAKPPKPAKVMVAKPKPTPKPVVAKPDHRAPKRVAMGLKEVYKTKPARAKIAEFLKEQGPSSLEWKWYEKNTRPGMPRLVIESVSHLQRLAAA